MDFRAIVTATTSLLLSLTAGMTTSGAVVATSLGASFHRNNYSIRALPRTMLPYIADSAGPLDGTYTFDDGGVAVRVVGDKKYDHPVLQAQFMLTRLSSYDYNQDPRYLERVKANGERLIRNAVLSRGAMYLPYPFNWALHGDRTDMMTPPWYSAMAQGQALSAFVRLYESTGEERYRKFADQLFASFLNLKANGLPWTVNVDQDGYLWFEEYAKDIGADRSVNGHIFALYGLYDYYRLTGSAGAATLFQGGTTAIEGHMAKIRNPGWISRYSLENQEYTYASYHSVHVGQLYQLYNMTGATSLATAADQFIEDYPAFQAGGRGHLAAGTHRASSVDAAGYLSGTRSFTLPAAEAVTISSRQRIAGQSGIWLKVSTGTMAGYWVPETPDRSYLKLGVETYRFDAVRLIRFQQGTYSGYQFDNLGLRTISKPFRLTANSAAHMDQRTIMNGITYFRVVDGVWRDLWVAAQPGVTLA